MDTYFISWMYIKNRPVLIAFLSVITLFVSLLMAFDPRWATNDDIAMSMIAHGYGLAAYGSPQLIFSNVLWGYLVRSVPTIHGVLGYSLASVAMLVMFGWTTLYFLLQLGARYLLCLLVIVLLIAQPILIQQFTVNAGLLTVAAVIGWQAHARLGGIGSLVTACLLAFFGYLIRSQEFLLVLGVALPFLPWRALRKQRQMQIAFLLLGMAIAAASAFDRWSYSGPEWQQFLAYNTVRIPITDYGAGERLKQHPEIIARYGYSPNDINLVANYFSADPQIANPPALNAMLNQLGPIATPDKEIKTGIMAIKALLGPVLLPLVVSAILLLVLMPRWSVVLGWLLCLGALFAMGVIGRPGIVRVYVPVISLLLIAPLMVAKYREGSGQRMVTLTLVIACIGHAYLLIPSALATQQWTRQILRDVHGFPAGPIVSWGNSFPFELIFPVLGNDLNSRSITFYGLDSFTYAPFSVASIEQHKGLGMIERLKSADGVPIITTPQKLEMLRIYCLERLQGSLLDKITYRTSWLSVQQVRCEARE